MGIYDRDYYRREGPSYIGSFMERGKVCKWLILVNIACFVLQILSPGPRFTGEDNLLPSFTDFMRLDADAVLSGQVWRLLTYAFVHSPEDFMHIVFNMLFLWWFGTDVEDLYGPWEFLTFYLTAAVASGVAFVLAWKAGWGNSPLAIGASGAVMAVVVVCAMHYPSRVIWIFGLVPMPIWLFVVFMVAKDWVTFAGHIRSTTAVSGHLGGALFGFAYYQMHWRLSSLLPSFKSIGRRPRARLRVYREEEEPRPAAVNAPASSDVDEQLEAKLDVILEKVARSGQASLTENERQILLRASEVYKRKKT